MAIGDNLRAQWDINTRGRADDDFYEHVNGVVETSAGTPTLEADGAEQAQNYDGTTSEYTEVTTWPGGLSTAFPNSDYTMAARVKLDTVDPGAFQSIFGAFKSGVAGLRVHLATETGSGQALGAQANGAAGRDAFLDAGAAGEIDDGGFHVVAQRRSGNVFTLWVDGVRRASTTVAAGSVTGLDRIGFAGRRRGGLVDWPLDGSITWAAIWDAAKSYADILALDDSVNPFLSGPALTASDDDLELGESSLPSPVPNGSVTVAASPAFGSAINAGTLDGVSVTAYLSSLTTAGAVLAGFDASLLRAGQPFNGLQLGAAQQLTLTDGTDSASVDITPQLGAATRFGQVSVGGIGANDAPGTTVGADRIGLWLVGEGVFIPETGAASASIFVGGEAQLLRMTFIGGAWVEGTVETFERPGADSGFDLVERQRFVPRPRAQRVIELRRFSRRNPRRLPGRRIRRPR